MRTARIALFTLALAARLPGALAHEGDAREAASPTEGRDDEFVADDLVPGTVMELKAALYRVERWSELFSDARAASQNADGTWSINFARFGHAHDFHVRRTPAGVVLVLAARDHGRGRLEYALEPYDATRSRLVVRFRVSTPPAFTPSQMRGLLRAKAMSDLSDFALRGARVAGSQP